MERLNMPEEIKSKQLVLRKHSIEMAKDVFDAVDRERVRLGEFLPWVKFTKTIKDAEDYVEQSLVSWTKQEGFGFNIHLRGSGNFIGKVGIHAVSLQDKRCEIGYWILSDYEGQGLMSEAVKALEKVCFKQGFNRLEIRCSSLNERSEGVPRRLNYQLEGILRQHIVENGAYRDTLIFSKLKAESGL